MPEAPIIAPAEVTYRGSFTNPERWALYAARPGDVIVCTPAKCGTTWTQAIVAHLLSGGQGLPGPVPVISPWIDGELGAPEDVQAALAAQPGRRVIKTHTPADGFPVWQGVHVIAVYRHPLDVFLSLRKHGQNMKNRPDHPMKRPIDVCLAAWLTLEMRPDDIDHDSLALLVAHYRRTASSLRLPSLTVLHYADMIADHAGTIRRLAAALGLEAPDALVERVVEATAFGAMKARAADFAPEGGKDFWEDDAAFFASGGTGNWRDALGAEGVAQYQARLAELVPEPALRRWLETGGTRP